jgi:hypothetical protein
MIKVYGYRNLGAIVCKLAQVECCMCHSPSVLCRWTDPLVAKPHCYRKAGPSLVTCPRIRPPPETVAVL